VFLLTSPHIQEQAVREDSCTGKYGYVYFTGKGGWDCKSVVVIVLSTGQRSGGSSRKIEQD
jgi:hypothetical protein